MSERDEPLAAFEILIGEWQTEATHPMFPDLVVTGTVSYEWLEGGRFVIHRSHNDNEKFPDAISVIGPPEEGDGLVMEYFDSRGVRRTYETSLEDGVLRVWRDHEGFDQRMTCEVKPDTFDAVHQLARERGDWQDDLRVTYRRAQRPATTMS